MKYEHYEILDFVKDEEFQKWVRSPDDKSDFYWHSWMQNHPEKKDLVLQARQLLLSIDFPARDASREEMQAIFKNIMINQASPSTLKIEDQSKIRSLKIRRAVSIAASLLLIATLVFIFYNSAEQGFSEEQPISQTITIKENPAGRKSKFQLDDGSIVKLNSSSQLKVAEGFGTVTREVFLWGEAYFEISKDPAKPFIVHVDDLSVLVTGTAFNIRAYADGEVISVAVVEGKVNTILKTGAEPDTLSLLKTDMAVYSKTNANLTKTSFDYLEMVGWKDGIIKFNGVKIKEAFAYLERWYGVNFYIKDQEHITDSFYGEFHNESLENVLDAMSRAMRFDFEINDSKIIVAPK